MLIIQVNINYDDLIYNIREENINIHKFIIKKFMALIYFDSHCSEYIILIHISSCLSQIDSDELNESVNLY